MAIAWVRGNGTQSSNSINIGAPVNSGDTVCVSVVCTNATGVSVSDDKGNTYVQAAVKSSDAGYYNYSFYLQNITNGPQTITATASGGIGGASIAADEFSGLGSGGLCGHGEYQVDSSTAGGISTSTFTTTSGGLIWAALVASVAGNSVGSGFTQDQAGSFLTEHLTPTSASSSSAATFTVASGGFMFVVALAFNAAIIPPPRRTIIRPSKRIGWST